MRRLILFTFLAGLVVFSVVQDRITADGASLYVTRQRAALASGGPTSTIAEVMQPAVRRSVQQGLLWGGGVVLVGLVAAVVITRNAVKAFREMERDAVKAFPGETERDAVKAFPGRTGRE